MMHKTFQYVFTSVIILTVFGLLAGCYTGPPPEPDEQVALQDRRDIVDPTLNEEILNLSDEAKLDSTDQLLETATTFRSEGQLLAAGYYLAKASQVLSLVNRDMLNERNQERYRDLVQDINQFYYGYVEDVEVLPGDVPPQVALAGLGEAQGDTAIDYELILPPEVTFDSSAVGDVLDTIGTLPPVPIVRNARVDSAIVYFLRGKGRKFFALSLQRGAQYIPMMQRILREEGVPEELVYLALIESGFNTGAYSYAHAAGPWQFIPSTGRIFGLKNNWWYDERRDPVKSTYAAARYLKKLYLDFNDWYLALASYNCGEGKVGRHVARYNTRDFWQLNRLPRETRNYVPSYLAATVIANNLQEYGFTEIEMREPEPLDSVLITECIDLEQAATLVGSDYETIKRLNPAILRWCTPPSMDEVWLYLPSGTVQRFNEGLAALPADQRHRWVVHKVRRGESLSTIAGHYGTSIRAIMALTENRISNPHSIRVGQSIYIPVAPDRYRASDPETRAREAITPQRQQITHKVRRGENLTLIARRYGTTVSAIKRWNNLYRQRYIQPGQRLTIWTTRAPMAQAETPTQTDTSPAQSTQTFTISHHTVRTGETVSGIAERYGMTIRRLASLNNLQSPYRIRIGQRLKVEERVRRSYVVKRGDALSTIAERHGVTIRQLKTWNRLRNTTIRIGQKLWVEPVEPAQVAEQTTPTEPTTTQQHHTVRSGESASTIAAKYGMTIRRLASLNNLQAPSYTIRTGQRLIVEGQARGYHTVRSGETLSGIAERYRMTIRQLAALNNISRPYTIRVGQRLLVQGEAVAEEAPNYHTVRAGESLWSIARQYGMTVNGLARLNGLRQPYVIRQGDRLKVAGAGSGPQFTMYTMQRGDTLWDIALRYNINISELKRINNITDPRRIRPGNKIKIPVR